MELVGRPADSPAVVRPRGGADAAEPIASLLAELHPDGTWAGCENWWDKWSGPGWRLLAAAQWGANPLDPRLHTAVEVLLADISGEGGFSAADGEPPSPWLTARTLQALAALGWGRHTRFQEALAWLDEAAPVGRDGGWIEGKENCTVTPVALLAALTASGDDRRDALRNRAAASIIDAMAAGDLEDQRLGHPSFDSTDPCEALWALANANVDLDPKMVPALVSLQAKQIDGGRWTRERDVPDTLPASPGSKIGQLSRWLTLHAAVAVLHYAVEAKLPRMYPSKPG